MISRAYQCYQTETEAEAGVEALGLAGGLEDSQASECEREDTGRVGGAGRLEVLAELEAGEGEALVVGGHGGLEAGEGREHVASPPVMHRAMWLRCFLRMSLLREPAASPMPASTSGDSALARSGSCVGSTARRRAWTARRRRGVAAAAKSRSTRGLPSGIASATSYCSANVRN